jgi:hypothetical protein
VKLVTNEMDQEDDFVDLVKSKFNKHSFSLIHLNIRSLSKNLDNFLTYLTQLHHSFSVIAISETWITTSDPDTLQIPGYERLQKNRSRPTCNPGGGVALYILD